MVDIASAAGYHNPFREGRFPYLPQWRNRMQSESLTIDGMEILENLEQTDQFIDENPFVLLYLSRLDCGVCKSLRPRVSTMMESFENSRTAYIDLDRMPE